MRSHTYGLSFMGASVQEVRPVHNSAVAGSTAMGHSSAPPRCLAVTEVSVDGHASASADASPMTVPGPQTRSGSCAVSMGCLNTFIGMHQWLACICGPPEASGPGLQVAALPPASVHACCLPPNTLRKLMRSVELVGMEVKQASRHRLAVLHDSCGPPTWYSMTSSALLAAHGTGHAAWELSEGG
jgi:hypothetical protein